MQRTYLAGVFAGYQVHAWLARNRPEARLIRVRFVVGSKRGEAGGAVVYYI